MRFFQIKYKFYTHLLAKEPTTEKHKVSSSRKEILFYGRIEMGEPNDPCMPELKWYISQK